MRFRLMSGIVAAACVLAAPAAHAFTMENSDNAGAYATPNFNLEEQARQFGTGNAASSSATKNQFETPLGKGTLQFGVGQNNFGSAFGPNFGTLSGNTATRQDFDRMLAPPGLQHLYDR